MDILPLLRVIGALLRSFRWWMGINSTSRIPQGIYTDAISISNNTLLVGDSGEHTGGIDYYAGVVRITEKDTFGQWPKFTTIQASDSLVGRRFGYACDIDGDLFVVGSFDEDSNPFRSTRGQAYIFRRRNYTDRSSWVQVRKISPDASPQQFGWSVSLKLLSEIINILVLGQFLYTMSMTQVSSTVPIRRRM